MKIFRHSVIQSLRNLSNEIFSSYFSQVLWSLEGWNLVHPWTMAGCIVYTGIRMLLLICPCIFSFFFLSNFQTLNIFVTLFSKTVRPRRLKLGTNVDNGWMYRVYRNQAARCSLFIPLFFFPILKHQIFDTFFFRNCEAWKVETWFICGQWVDVSCIPESGCCYYLSLYFSFFFLSNFQTLKIFVPLFSGTVRPRRLKIGTHVDNGWLYHDVYTGIRLLSLIRPFIIPPVYEVYRGYIVFVFL